MKQIESISIWDNGKNQNAEILNAYCINDNLSNSATFYYSLMSEEKQQLAQGNLSMTGDVYQGWETNEYAYDWIAEQLNLTIIGDYVPPVPEPIIETIVEPVIPEVTEEPKTK